MAEWQYALESLDWFALDPPDPKAGRVFFCSLAQLETHQLLCQKCYYKNRRGEVVYESRLGEVVQKVHAKAGIVCTSVALLVCDLLPQAEKQRAEAWELWEVR